VPGGKDKDKERWRQREREKAKEKIDRVKEREGGERKGIETNRGIKSKREREREKAETMKEIQTK